MCYFGDILGFGRHLKGRRSFFQKSRHTFLGVHCQTVCDHCVCGMIVCRRFNLIDVMVKSLFSKSQRKATGIGNFHGPVSSFPVEFGRGNHTIYQTDSFGFLGRDKATGQKHTQSPSSSDGTDKGNGRRYTKQSDFDPRC